MDERQRLQTDLKRYRSIRDLVYDEQLIATIGELIRETEERLARIEGRVELGGPVPKAEEAGAANLLCKS